MGIELNEKTNVTGNEAVAVKINVILDTPFEKSRYNKDLVGIKQVVVGYSDGSVEVFSPSKYRIILVRGDNLKVEHLSKDAVRFTTRIPYDLSSTLEVEEGSEGTLRQNVVYIDTDPRY